MCHIYFHRFVPQTFMATGDKILTKAGKVPFHGAYFINQ